VKDRQEKEQFIQVRTVHIHGTDGKTVKKFTQTVMRTDRKSDRMTDRARGQPDWVGGGVADLCRTAAEGGGEGKSGKMSGRTVYA
jgi:hypothetical protein